MNPHGTGPVISNPNASPYEIILELAESKGLLAATSSALLSSYILGFPMEAAVQFGALVSLGTSLGDTALTLGGIGSKVEAYINKKPFATYFDPNDFLGGAVGTAVAGLLIGMRDRQLLYATLIGAGSAGVAPKLSSYILNKQWGQV